MGSNYCKNIVYDSCKLTRFDAHSGVLNGKIINSTVSAITIIGGGDMLIENSTIIGRGSASFCKLLDLRSDYGSTWEGTITIKDCIYDFAFGSSITGMNIVAATYTNHNFGYETHLPNIVVDNLMFADSGITKVNIYNVSIASNQSELAGQTMFDAERFILSEGSVVQNVNPYIAPDYVVIKNNSAGVSYVLKDSAYFDGTTTVGCEGGESDLPIVD